MNYRSLAKGMGEAVAKRTVLRTKESGELETWDDVAHRVAEGNASLLRLVGNQSTVETQHISQEQDELYRHIANGTVLMSGRHLQHGDNKQLERNMEVFTNCATATMSFVLFYLLLNGSGVGRAYDDDLCVVDWNYLPHIRLVLDATHPDFEPGKDETPAEAREKYPDDDSRITWYAVHDSREGWAKIIETLEIAAYRRTDRERILVIDWSGVRAKGAPIGGMQNRPSSGPKPVMQAIRNICSLQGTSMAPWKQAMWVDHYLAESVLVGGARRSARMSTKFWKDPGVLEFINIKKNGFLWSSNNSITVDSEFWRQEDDQSKQVLQMALEASYHHGTGEPGFINQDKLHENREGLDDYKDYVHSLKYVTYEKTGGLLDEMVSKVMARKYIQITNPCGEISLNMLGGYCVIADVVPYHAESKNDALEAFRAATRSLIRVNLMDSLYNAEVKRTNRIGVGMTGVHEYAWKAFGYGFRDLIDEKRSLPFWESIREFSNAVKEEAKIYSQFLGVKTPHTDTTVKPAGTTSKLFGLTEGVHLPSMKEFLRWVQFRSDDPLIAKYRELGYPTRELKVYHGTTIVGFPTQPEICRLGMGEKLVTAADATPEEQYQWLMLLEKYYLQESGNQISYTLKYRPELVGFEEYKEMLIKYQSQVRCCSVMPQSDTTKYEYQPEEPVSPAKFLWIVQQIKDSTLTEDIDLESLKCASGACPI